MSFFSTRFGQAAVSVPASKAFLIAETGGDEGHEIDSSSIVDREQIESDSLGEQIESDSLGEQIEFDSVETEELGEVLEKSPEACRRL